MKIDFVLVEDNSYTIYGLKVEEWNFKNIVNRKIGRVLKLKNYSWLFKWIIGNIVKDNELYIINKMNTFCGEFKLYFFWFKYWVNLFIFRV